MSANTALTGLDYNQIKLKNVYDVKTLHGSVLVLIPMCDDWQLAKKNINLIQPQTPEYLADVLTTVPVHREEGNVIGNHLLCVVPVDIVWSSVVYEWGDGSHWVIDFPHVTEVIDDGAAIFKYSQLSGDCNSRLLGHRAVIVAPWEGLTHGLKIAVQYIIITLDT